VIKHLLKRKKKKRSHDKADFYSFNLSCVMLIINQGASSPAVAYHKVTVSMKIHGNL
jgi:hypothetical protein